MSFAYRRPGFHRELTSCQCPVTPGTSSGAVGAVGALLFLLGRVCVYIALWVMSMHSLLSCDCLMVHCAPLVTHICRQLPILVGAASLKAMLGMRVRRFSPKPTWNHSFYCAATSMRALDSVYLIVLAHPTRLVCLAIVLFVRGVSGFCNCVQHFHCAY